MTDQEKRNLVDRYIGAYNAFDVPGMMATLHPDIRFENVAEGEITASAAGTDEFRALAEHAKELFESRNQTVTSFSANGDGASAEISYEGIIASDLPNGMKAGEVIRLEGRSEFAFKDGRIFSIVDYS